MAVHGRTGRTGGLAVETRNGKPTVNLRRKHTNEETRTQHMNIENRYEFILLI